MSGATSIVFVVEESDLLELQQRYDALSRREREVMVRVAAGMLNKQIGASLSISEITVKAHRGQVMRKMQARSMAELVRMAVMLRLTPTAIPARPSFLLPEANVFRMARP